MRVYKKDGVKDLHGFVRIQGGSDVGDIAEVSINEFAQTRVIFHCAAPGAATDVEFKLGDAERVLHIDQHQPGFGRISGGRLKSILPGPVPCLLCALFIGNPPNGANFAGVKKFRDREIWCIHEI